MSQLRQDIRAHPWAAVLVVGLFAAAWALAFATRAEARDNWPVLGLEATVLLVTVVAATVWLRRDARAHPWGTALVVTGLAGTLAYFIATSSPAYWGDQWLLLGLALGMLVDGAAAALVCRARGGGAPGVRGGLLAAGLLGAFRMMALSVGGGLADWLATGHAPNSEVPFEGGWLGWLGTAWLFFIVLVGIPALLAGLVGVAVALGEQRESAPAPPVSVG